MSDERCVADMLAEVYRDLEMAESRLEETRELLGEALRKLPPEKVKRKRRKR